MNKPKLNLKSLVALALVCIIAGASGYYARGFSGLSPVFMPLSQLKGVGYTFTQIGGIYYGVNGITGMVDYSGTNASEIVEGCIGTGDITILFLNGVYTFTNPIMGKNQTYLRGESRGSWFQADYLDYGDTGVILDYTGGVVDAFLDFRNVHDYGIQDLKIRNLGGASGVRGLYTGSDELNNRPKYINLNRFNIYDFSYGIAGYVQPPDDSLFEDVFISNADEIGIDFMSSQVLMVRGGVVISNIAVRITRTVDANPVANMQFLSSVFSGNAIDVDISGNQTTYPISFIGCWFEGTTQTFLRTSTIQDDVHLEKVLFDNCVIATMASCYALMDLRGAWGYYEFDGGQVYPLEDGEAIWLDGRQQLRIWKSHGYDRVTFNGTARGFECNQIQIINDANGANGVVSSTWGDTWQAQETTFNGGDVVNATVYYRWNPNSTGAGICLNYGGDRFGIVEPASAGMRLDIVDVTMYARDNMSLFGDIAFQTHGNNVDAPIILWVSLFYEY